MTKNKVPDPFAQYLSEQVKHWKGKIEDIEDDIERYNRRRATAFQQVSYCRMKLKTLAECKAECCRHLEAAEEQLTSIRK